MILERVAREIPNILHSLRHKVQSSKFISRNVCIYSENYCFTDLGCSVGRGGNIVSNLLTDEKGEKRRRQGRLMKMDIFGRRLRCIIKFGHQWNDERLYVASFIPDETTFILRCLSLTYFSLPFITIHFSLNFFCFSPVARLSSSLPPSPSLSLSLCSD